MISLFFENLLGAILFLGFLGTVAGGLLGFVLLLVKLVMYIEDRVNAFTAYLTLGAILLIFVAVFKTGLDVATTNG